MNEIPKTIDELEDAVEEIDVPHERIILTFRNFIKKLASEGRFANISNAELDPLLRYLNMELISSALESNELRSQSNLELARLASHSKNNDPYYHLARCVRLIYVDSLEWERVAQDTLLFSFFFHLIRIFDDIETEFVKYFSDALLCK